MNTRALLITLVFLVSLISVSATCTDNDGSNYGLASYVTDVNGTTHNDYCADYHTLVEMGCEGAYVSEKRFYCDYKCIEGKCVDAPVVEPIACVDMDGEDFFTKSYIIDEWGKQFYDECQPREMLLERVCRKNIGSEKYKRCDYKCIDGRCIIAEEPTCVDPDSKNLSIQTTVVDEDGRTLKDVCESHNKVSEAICENGKAIYKIFQCNGECKNGACEEVETAVMCSSDKTLCYGDYTTKCVNNKWIYEKCEYGCDSSSSGCRSSPTIIEEETKAPVVDKSDPIVKVPETKTTEPVKQEIKETTSVSIEQPAAQPEQVVETKCSGCEDIDGHCYSIGQRIDQIGVKSYCSNIKDIINQKNNGESCQDGFECLSSACVDRMCQDKVVLYVPLIKRFFSFVNEFLFH
ncbi:hypothetical protein COT47_07860 [Candidatus Woesearchaeota archaeon CG08_land_8_20_14_0_20_43_7]|nr:MAG: hypothetical protein COT47_07860 [Candidatus Woesearchaeota archaeon CG08_land_8_20_14_0_20_43_7]